jgi:DNA (cytosine-5)-methyltransferase 1
MKILNLYACLGGNRYKWGDEHDITAVELDKELAKLYQERFPNDTVIVADAHQYLLDHYKEFDFIWTSPPCPTHSKIRMTQKNTSGFIPKYPDMKLYEEILFLQNYFDGKFIVENVIPYYEPLIPAQKRGRHLYWSNFLIPNVLSERKFKIGRERDEVKALCRFHDYNFYKYKGKQRKDKIARNLVDYEAGKTILDTAMGIIQKQDINQTELF